MISRLEFYEGLGKDFRVADFAPVASDILALTQATFDPHRVALVQVEVLVREEYDRHPATLNDENPAVVLIRRFRADRDIVNKGFTASVDANFARVSNQFYFVDTFHLVLFFMGYLYEKFDLTVFYYSTDNFIG